MKLFLLKAARAIAIDGVSYDAGETVAQVVIDCPLGCLESLMRSGQVIPEEVADQLLVDGNLEAILDRAEGELDLGDETNAGNQDPNAGNGETPKRTPAKTKKVANLGFPKPVVLALTAAGLATVGDVREHLEAFESLDDIEGLDTESRSAVIAAVQ